MESSTQPFISPTVIEHAQTPRNRGPLETFNGHARITGPCGDTMEFWVFAGGEVVEQVSFITDGCGPSLASGSMATCLAQGKQLRQAAAISQQDILSALGGLPAEVDRSQDRRSVRRGTRVDHRLRGFPDGGHARHRGAAFHGGRGVGVAESGKLVPIKGRNATSGMHAPVWGQAGELTEAFDRLGEKRRGSHAMA
jgi:NifU-like protein involved in Fe-S cluster formation